MLIHHEMWRDELQAWLIACNSSSLYGLFQNLIIEIHPGLWHLMLYALTFFTRSPAAMQFLHWAIAGLIVYIVSRYSPFTRIQKALFPFGYMIVFEYGVVCRSYSTGVLLIFVMCCLFPRRYARFLSLSAVLFLLANTSFIGLIIAAATGVSLALECIARWGAIVRHVSRIRLTLGYYIILIGCVLSAAKCTAPSPEWQLTPGRYHTTISLSDEWFSSVAFGFFPILPWRLNFWEEFYFVNLMHARIKVALNACLIALTCAALWRTRTALSVYFFSTLGMMLFYLMIQPGLLRHYGYHYVMFVAALWMMRREEEERDSALAASRVYTAARSLVGKLFYLILIVQILCAVYPVYADVRYDFSAGERTARWIRASHMEDWLIVGHPSGPATSVVGYLDRKLYELAFDRISAFPCQPVDGKFSGEFPRAIVLDKIPPLRDKHGPRILFIFNFPLTDAEQRRYGLRAAAQFTGTIVEHEQFYIYIFNNVPAS